MTDRMTITTPTDDDLIWRGSVLERLELAEHDAEERDWRSGANEIARLRKYVEAIPAVQPAPVAMEPAMREETELEHMARDMREGRFPEQSPRQMVPVEESAGDLLARLGMDGRLWAEEFHKTAQRLGYPPMDEGWLIGWFCNAIMAGHDHAARPVAEVTAEALAGAMQAAAEYLEPSKRVRWLTTSTLLEVPDAETRAAILAITPTDAAAALDRIRAEAREAALREALEVAIRYSHLPDGGKVAQMILALIGGAA